MENNNVTKQEVLKFSAEMEEEASVKMAIANVCGVNATDIRIVMGGRDTISEKIKNKMITPEILYAMDKAIISILIKKDLEDAWNGTTWKYEGNIQGKTRFWYYCDEVDKRTAEDIKHRLPCITHPACSSRETPRN